MKKVIICGILLLGLVAFQPVSVSRSSENLKVAETLFTHFNNHDWEALAHMYVPDAEFKDPAYGLGIHKKSRAEIIEHYSGLNQMFPDIKDEVVQFYPSGEDTVVVEFISRGTSVEGEPFELAICAILVITNGQISKDFVYYDNF